MIMGTVSGRQTKNGKKMIKSCYDNKIPWKQQNNYFSVIAHPAILTTPINLYFCL